MSCATIRTRLPARRTLPSSSVATSSVTPISRRVCSRFLNRMTEPREITRSERILESCAIVSSVIPSAKNSFSGSVLRLRNGRTATDGSLGAGASATPARAWAKAAALGNRSAGSTASARMIACSTAGATPGRCWRTRGGGSLNRLAITLLAVVPVCGGSPASSS